MNSLVSIIIPVYNVETYVEQCIQSVLKQTYKNIEIIIIDDGSTDKSGEICEEYAKIDKRIKLIHKKNGGAADARNKGLEICMGEYVFFVDSDDLILSNAIERLVFECKQYNADLVMCGMFFDNQLRRSELNLGKKCIYNNKELVYNYVTDKYINESVCNKLYHRSLLDRQRFYPMKKNEDVCFTVQVLSNVKKAIYVDESLYVQNIRLGSLERSKFCEKDLAGLYAVKLKTEHLKLHYPELFDYIKYEYAKTIVSLLKKINMEWSYTKNKSIYLQLCQELKNEIKKIGEEDWKELNNPIKKPCLFKVHYMIVGVAKKIRYIGKVSLIKIKNYGYQK